MAKAKLHLIAIISFTALLLTSCCHPQTRSPLVDKVVSIEMPVLPGYVEVVLPLSDVPRQALDAERKIWDCPRGNSWSRISVRVEEYKSSSAALRRYRGWLRDARDGHRNLPDITETLEESSADRITIRSYAPGADAYFVIATYSRLFVLISFQNSGMTDDQAAALATLIITRIDEVLEDDAP